MYLLPEVIAEGLRAVRLQNSTVTGIIFCHSYVHTQAGLFRKETDKGHVQIKESFRPAFKNPEKFVLIILEVC